MEKSDVYFLVGEISDLLYDDDQTFLTDAGYLEMLKDIEDAIREHPQEFVKKIREERIKRAHSLEMCYECFGDLECEMIEEHHPYGDTVAVELLYSWVCKDCGKEFDTIV
jgi:uncharacterized protein with PIN domain